MSAPSSDLIPMLSSFMSSTRTGVGASDRHREGKKRALALVSDTPSRSTQDCSTCPTMQSCWIDSKRTEQIALNLLVCRIQIGLRRNEAAKALLTRLRPKLKAVARSILDKIGPYIQTSKGEIYADLRSHVIEVILTTFEVGGKMKLLPFLFNRRNGAVRTWRRDYIARAMSLKCEMFVDPSMRHGANTPSSYSHFEDAARALNRKVTNQRIRSSPLDQVLVAREGDIVPLDRILVEIRTAIDDGKTFSTNEYRLLKMFDALSNDHVEASHDEIATLLGWRRPDVTLTFRAAVERIVDRLGFTKRVLTARGVDVDALPRELLTQSTRVIRRRSVTSVLPSDRSFVQAHIGHVPDQDIAWALNMSHDLFKTVKRAQ